MDFKQLTTRTGEELSQIKQLDKENLLKDLLLHEEILAPGKRSSRTHFHSTKQECMYVLEGEIFVVSSEEEKSFRAGELILVPPGGKGHHLENRSSSPARYFSVATQFRGDRVTFVD